MDEVRNRRAIIAIIVIALAIIVGLGLYLHYDTKTEASSQTTDTVLMVSPVAFDYNEETAVNNAFQKKGKESESETEKQAKKESDEYIKMLKDNGINVITVKDTKKPHTPDLECIETNGGGSARCMIAEIF